jgi:hypothetical protein
MGNAIISPENKHYKTNGSTQHSVVTILWYDASHEGCYTLQWSEVRDGKSMQMLDKMPQDHAS